MVVTKRRDCFQHNTQQHILFRELHNTTPLMSGVRNYHCAPDTDSCSIEFLNFACPWTQRDRKMRCVCTQPAAGLRLVKQLILANHRPATGCIHTQCIFWSHCVNTQLLEKIWNWEACPQRSPLTGRATQCKQKNMHQWRFLNFEQLFETLIQQRFLIHSWGTFYKEEKVLIGALSKYCALSTVAMSKLESPMLHLVPVPSFIRLPSSKWCVASVPASLIRVPYDWREDPSQQTPSFIMHKNTHEQDNNIFPILCFIFNIFRGIWHSYQNSSFLFAFMVKWLRRGWTWTCASVRVSGDVTIDCWS